MEVVTARSNRARAWPTGRIRLLAVVAAVIALVYVGWMLARSGAGDFVAFYCGGVAVRVAADPYRTEPLRACEHRNSAWNVEGAEYVIPDPVPPFDQALFALGSRLDMGALRSLWLVSLFAAFAATVVLLARVTGLAVSLVAATLFVSDFYCSALLGQMPPICILGIVLAGWAMLRSDGLALAVGLTLAMIEPHIGGPAVAAVLLFGGRLRWSAVCAIAVLAVVSIVAMPPAEIVEYFTKVLPAHALSEVNAEGQYGVSYHLHAIGVSEAASVALGRYAYVFALVAGLAIAWRAQSIFGRAAIVFVPCAVVLIGSPYLHLTQMAAAMPAALLVATQARSRVAGLAVALLSIPWMDFGNALRVFPIVAATFYATLRRFAGVHRRAAIWTVLAALVFLVFAANYESSHEIGDIFRYGTVSPSDLPETVWKTILDAQEHRYPLLAEIAKIPTELGLGLLTFVLVRACLRPRPQTWAKSRTSAANCSS